MKLEEAADILGVAQNADLATLRQAYRKMAIGFHPDKVWLVLPTFVFKMNNIFLSYDYAFICPYLCSARTLHLEKNFK